MKALQNFLKKGTKSYDKVQQQDSADLSTQDSLNLNGEEIQIPKGHKKTDISQAEQCPVMKIKMKQNLENQQLQVYDPEDIEKKKQKKMKGGCPFMPSEKKKNPGLQEEIKDAYSMLYISNRNYLLQNKGFSLKKDPSKNNREKFDTYPIYLKHTLFHSDDPQMVKARQCEMSQKFFIYDQFREKGNKFFRKNDFHMALTCYEHAFSIIRWVELLDEEDIEEMKLEEQQKKERQEEFEKELKIKEENEKLQEKQKIIKKTKKGAKLPYSINKQNKKQAEFEALLRENDEEEEDIKSDSEQCNSDQEEEFKEDEQEKIKRQQEQQKRQEELYRRAQQQIIKSSVPNGKQNGNDIQDNVSDCNSLEKGVRSDIDSQEDQNSRRSSIQDISDCNSDNQNNNSDMDINDDDNNEDWEDHDSQRSDIAVGDEREFQERHKEIEREQRQEKKRQEELEKLIKEQQEESKNEDENVINMDQKKQNENIQNIKDKEIRQKAEEMMKQRDEDKEFQKKYRLLLTTFNDENTLLKDGDELTDSHEIDMRQGMLITILINMSIVFQKLGYFQNALEALDDAEKVAQCKCSQIYYRRSKAKTHDLSSTLQQLKEAKEDIELGMRIKHTEKMFQQEKGILKILNLFDHEEAFKAQAILVTDKIHKLREANKEKITDFLQRAAQIEEIYQDMVKDGIIKEGEYDRDNHFFQQEEGEEKLEGVEEKIHAKIKHLDDYKEREIMTIMVEKYYSMVDFYAEQNKDDKLEGIKLELQDVLKIQHEMNFYYSLDVSQHTKDEIVLEVNQECKVEFQLDRVKKRLDKLKRDYAREIYESANFNFHMLEYAIKLYYKKVHRLRDQLDELKKKRLNRDRVQGQSDLKPGYFGGNGITNILNMGGFFSFCCLMFFVLSFYTLQRSGVFKDIMIDFNKSFF